ncbi:MAG: methyl-accepting chemotaxis protein [Bacillota bacterium]
MERERLQEAYQWCRQLNTAIQTVLDGTAKQGTRSAEILELVGRVNEALESVATGTAQQARDVDQTLLLAQEMADSTQTISDSVNNLAQAAAETLKAANVGARSVVETIKGITELRQTVMASAESIDSLSNQWNKIQEILAVIEDISRQTNLLSLNAAIEAARAGEHGRGFVVVAEEVRRLADRSDRAAKEIGQLIQEIRRGNENAVCNMQAQTTQVEEGVGLAEAAGEALRHIEQTVAVTNAQIETVKQHTDGNHRRITGLVTALQSIAAVTEENAATTEELAAANWFSNAVRGFRDQVEETMRAADQLEGDLRRLATLLEPGDTETGQ